MREETRNWLLQAEMDLETAEANIGIKKYFAAAFFSQQAAEKALKALSLEKFREPLKSHNLLELAKKARVPHEVMRGLMELNADFIITRYPDAANGLPYELYDRQKAEQKTAYARVVLSWAKKQMQ
jgi:HEPN domain-containing protein